MSYKEPDTYLPREIPVGKRGKLQIKTLRMHDSFDTMYRFRLLYWKDGQEKSLSSTVRLDTYTAQLDKNLKEREYFLMEKCLSEMLTYLDKMDAEDKSEVHLYDIDTV